MDTGIYERMITTNDSLFKWNTNFILVLKLNQVQLYLTFNYYFIYEEISTSHMKGATTVHKLFKIQLYQCLFLVDIKHRYWAVNVHLDDHYYLIFHIPDAANSHARRS